MVQRAIDMRFRLDLPPYQHEITEDLIREMLTWTPRRMKLALEWQTPVHDAQGAGKDPTLVLPFREGLQSAFEVMCAGTNYFAYAGKRPTNFLRDDDAVTAAKAWCDIVGKYVAIRDCLAVSFALDYRSEGGDPDAGKTIIGDLCRRAKPYGDEKHWDAAAADELAARSVAALGELTCYACIDCVVAVPPSRLDKPFDLPSHLAARVAGALGKPDLSDRVRTVAPRKQLKGLAVADKLDELKETVRVDPDAFKGKAVLLLDDLYQSGTSINYIGMLLLQAGAKKVLGLACEKTVRNDDNVSGGAR